MFRYLVALGKKISLFSMGLFSFILLSSFLTIIPDAQNALSQTDLQPVLANVEPVLAAVEPMPAQKPPVRSKIQPTIEVKNGYFFFTDSKMKKVYNNGGWDIQLSGSYPIWRWLQIYGSVEYLEKHGRSMFDNQRTSIWEVPLSLGLKPVIRIRSWLQYYFAGGLRYFFVHQTNHSSYVDKHISQNGLGGFVNTGFNFIFWRHFLLDVFGEYSSVTLRFHPHKKGVEGRNAHLSGMTFGLGVGYAF